MNFGQPLLVTMNEDFGKVGQVLVELCQSFGIIAREQNLFPQVFRRMRTFDRLNEEVDSTLFFANGSILGIGKRTGGSITESRDGIGMLAKVGLVALGFANGRFEGTKLVIDHLPYHFIVLHGSDVVVRLLCSSTRKR